MVGLLMMFLARLAYRRVDKVSQWFTSAGEMVAIMMVFALPPKESFNNQVNVESLKKKISTQIRVQNKHFYKI